MTASAEQILEQALLLPPSERIVLVDRLLYSLDLPDSPFDEAWGEEIKRRQELYKSGKCKTLSLEEFVDRIPNI